MPAARLDELLIVRVDKANGIHTIGLKWNPEPFLAVASRDLPEKSAMASLAYRYYRMGLAATFFSILRKRYPVAFFLTNEKEPPILKQTAGSGRIEYAELDWYFDWTDQRIDREGGSSTLIKLDSQDLSPYLSDLLGLNPMPTTYVLILGKQAQSLAAATQRFQSIESSGLWSVAILDIFDLAVVSTEADYLVVITKDEDFLRDLGI